jgi:hypothetical protein
VIILSMFLMPLHNSIDFVINSFDILLFYARHILREALPAISEHTKCFKFIFDWVEELRSGGLLGIRWVRVSGEEGVKLCYFLCDISLMTNSHPFINKCNKSVYNNSKLIRNQKILPLRS